jgi:hypothetical protein
VLRVPHEPGLVPQVLPWSSQPRAHRLGREVNEASKPHRAGRLAWTRAAEKLQGCLSGGSSQRVPRAPRISG